MAERWDLIGTYAYTHTEILDDPDDEGHRLADAPKHSASLYLTHHLQVPSQFGAWHAGGGARYIGERAGNNANDFWMSSYTVADAFVRWDAPLVGYRTALQFNVENRSTSNTTRPPAAPSWRSTLASHARHASARA